MIKDVLYYAYTKSVAELLAHLVIQGITVIHEISILTH